MKCAPTLRWTIALLAWSLVGLSTRAADITFRPDPFGNPGQTFQINGFDPGPGNLLAQGFIPAVAAGGGDINVVFQSQLTNVLPNAALPGLGTTYQILTLANFRVNVTPVAADAVVVGNPTTPGPNVFELRYHNLAVPINEKTGAGYNTVGDPVILSGRVVNVSGASLLDTLAPPIDLDQSGTGPDGTPTLTFNGAQDLQIAVDFVNPLFFPDPNAILVALNVSTQTSAPFITVTPNMGVFFTGDARNLGATNSLDGPDTLSQSDPSISVVVRVVDVPEPASLGLLLLGLGGLGIGRVARKVRATKRHG